MKRTDTEVRTTLRRMLANGPLTALPRRPRDLDVFLKLAAARFELRRGYSEEQVNDLLQAWLEPFCSPYGIDHVTVRRCLVDSRLLVRDRAGSTYELAKRVSAPEIEPAAIMAEVQRERVKRKRAHSAELRARSGR
jgi:hypothetical protein